LHSNKKHKNQRTFNAFAYEISRKKKKKNEAEGDDVAFGGETKVVASILLKGGWGFG
jgi:hypothetical protein